MTLRSSRGRLTAVATTLVLLSLAIGGPAAAQDDGSFPFLDTELTLVSFGGQAVPAEVTATATFGSDGEVFGSASCNNYNSTYTVNGQAISIGDVSSTFKMCEPSVIEIETPFLMAMDEAVSWSATDDSLTITSADGTEMVFSTGAGGGTTDGLTGVEWTLVSLAGTAVPDGVVATAIFGDDGQVGGNASCNNYSGPYTVDGDSISIGILGVQRMFCEGPAMEVETPFLRAMEAADSWAIEGGQLTLIDADGGGDLVFSAGSAGPVGSSWQLVTLGGEVVPADVTVTLEASPDGRLAGNAGCNNYFGSYTVDGQSVTVDEDLGSTMMFCEGPGSEVETAYLAALAVVTGWSVGEDGNLTLTGSGAELVFAPADAAGDSGGMTGLIGTTWTLTGMMGMSFMASVQPTLLFGDDGTYSGNAGCNDYHGTFEIADASITISQPGFTKKLCADMAMAMGMEQAYLEILPTMTRWQVDGSELILADESGMLLLTFSAS